MKDHKLSDKTVFFNIVSMMNKQVEGAAEEDGRTRSIWDVFAHAGFYYLLFLLSISLSIENLTRDVHISSMFHLQDTLEEQQGMLHVTNITNTRSPFRIYYNISLYITCDRLISLTAAPTKFVLQEDVKLMVDIGLDAYRFSISWSRLLPSKVVCPEIH